MNILIHLLLVLVSMQGNSINQLSVTNQHQFQDSPISVEINQEFGITEGNSVKLNGKGTSMQLVKVSDSRCPKGVNCIRAGEIEVDVVVTIESRVNKFTLRNPTWERGGTMEANLGDGLFVSLNGTLQEQNQQRGKDLEVAFVFTEVAAPLDTPKSH